MNDQVVLRWLASRVALLLAAILAIVGVPIVCLMAVPTGYFAEHAAFHAAWQSIVIFGGGVLAFRAVVRWSRVPHAVVGAVLLSGAAAFALVAFIVLRGTRAELQFLVFTLVFTSLAVFNVLALAKAWRAGWRPPVFPQR